MTGETSRGSTKRPRPDSAPVGFPAELHGSLSTIALVARKTVLTEATAELLTAILEPVTPPAGGATPPSPRSENVGLTSSIDLAAAYPEVRAIRLVHKTRTALRSLQGCAAPSRPAFFRDVAEALDGIYGGVVPDELFAALGKVFAEWADEGREGGTPPREVTRVLETQALQVVEALQLEVLRQSNNLTQRASTITLRYRHQIPFCS